MAEGSLKVTEPVYPTPSLEALTAKVCAYDSSPHTPSLIATAYDFAEKAHSSQKRASGVPYFHHLFNTALILAELKVDGATIAAALLHDTLEDTSTNIQDLKGLFGEQITQIVQGVTKLSRLSKPLDHERQAENLRRFVVAIAGDIRVLLVKLADRLHNMRTLKFIASPDRRKHIATETMEIYAPLAERIGMFTLGQELDQMAFEELEPKIHRQITTQLERLTHTDKSVVDTTVITLRQLMKSASLKATVKGRIKQPHSIWSKMQRRKVGMEHLTDITAFRIVLENRQACYEALGTIHKRFSCVPGFFKDYISTPKPNGYQSIHTAVIGDGGEILEIQLRSKRMDKIAEYGLAAHWRYKQDIPAIQDRKWLEEWQELTEEGEKPTHLLSHTKLHMYRDQVFCFSPKGKLVVLPQGATAIDFAYAIHSEVGECCHRARINGVGMPIHTEVKNGDRVNIITAATSKVSPDWEKWATTARAKFYIRRFIKGLCREEFVEIGKQIIAQAAKREANLLPIDEKLAKQLGCHNPDQVFERLGSGMLSVQDIFRRLHSEETANVVSLNRFKEKPPTVYGEVVDANHKRLSVKPANCCMPVPGDEIVLRGNEIHAKQCATTTKSGTKADKAGKADKSGKAGDGLQQVSWAETEGSYFPTRIEAELFNKPGNLGGVAVTIGKNQSNIDDIKIIERTEQKYLMVITIEVKNKQHLDSIIAALEADDGVQHIVRRHK